MEVYLEIAGNQIDGARDYQEDAFLSTYVDDSTGESKSSALVVMADGMGGHAAGNIASNLVVSTFNNSFTGRFAKGDQGDVPNILRDALAKANNALSAAIKETPALDGMGCTMVVAAISRGRMWWISVGDSHLYVIRDRQLHKKNEDHSYGGYLDRMKAQGMDVEAEQGLSRNMLMSAMTGEDIAEIDCPNKPDTLLPGDRVIIASDGLDTLSEGTIIQTAVWSPTPKECVEALLKAVEDAKRPRQDNTTVIVVDVVRRDGAGASDTEPTTRKRDMDETQPMDMSELRTEARTEPRTQPRTETTVRDTARRFADVDDEEDEEPEERTPSKGLLAGIAVAVVLAVAAGGWFLFGGRGKTTEHIPTQELAAPPPAASTTPSPATAPAGTGTAPAPAAAETGTTTAPAPAPAESAPAKTGAAPKLPLLEIPIPPATGTQAPAAPGKTAKAVPATPKAAPAKAPQKTFRDKLKIGGEGPLMVRIPGGSFLMGSRGSTDADERPQHRVTVKPFAMSAYEITFAEYDRFAKATGRRIPNNHYLDKKTFPVFDVSWDDALAYTQWLTKETGHRYRLPSEAEWEYAASAGTDTPYWWGYGSPKNRAHCFQCTPTLNPREPTKVGSFAPNPFGIYDTVGNVAEWVHDCYHDTYRGAPTDGSVWEGGDCSVRVVRGGSFESPNPTARKRDKYPANGTYPDVGIRIVRDP